ncbi:hypothetical protein Pelo_5986 [Pelomyxa schiedti]|nr:hypothetical protein Pelo_5986 [Pelomyxa schiedti]
MCPTVITTASSSTFVEARDGNYGTGAQEKPNETVVQSQQNQLDGKAQHVDKFDGCNFGMALNACLGIVCGGLGMKPFVLPTTISPGGSGLVSIERSELEKLRSQVDVLQAKEKERDALVSEMVTLLTDLLSALPPSSASTFNVDPQISCKPPDRKRSNSIKNSGSPGEDT